MGAVGGEGLADCSLALPPLTSTQAMAFDGLDGLDLGRLTSLDWNGFPKFGSGSASR